MKLDGVVASPREGERKYPKVEGVLKGGFEVRREKEELRSLKGLSILNTNNKLPTTASTLQEKHHSDFTVNMKSFKNARVGKVKSIFVTNFL